MEKRPLSLTIIGWLLVLGAVFSLYAVMTIGSNPMAADLVAKSGVSMAVHQAMGAVGALVSLACAYGIFKGLPWSRVLYVAWGIVGIVFGVLTGPMIAASLVGLLFFAVITFFLFRPAANGWFAAKGMQLHRSEG